MTQFSPYQATLDSGMIIGFSFTKETVQAPEELQKENINPVHLFV